MMYLILGSIIFIIFISGCVSPTTTVTSCSQYCEQQPHINCTGKWNVSGNYPNCKCDFICNFAYCTDASVFLLDATYNPDTSTLDVGIYNAGRRELSFYFILGYPDGDTRYPDRFLIKQQDRRNVTLQNVDSTLMKLTLKSECPGVQDFYVRKNIANL